MINLLLRKRANTQILAVDCSGQIFKKQKQSIFLSEYLNQSSCNLTASPQCSKKLSIFFLHEFENGLHHLNKDTTASDKPVQIMDHFNQII